MAECAAACAVDIGDVFGDLWGTSDEEEESVDDESLGRAAPCSSAPSSVSSLPRVACECSDLPSLSAFVSSPDGAFSTGYRSKKPAILVGFASQWRVFSSIGAHNSSAVHAVLANCSSDNLVDVLHSNNSRHFFGNELCYNGKLRLREVVLSECTMRGGHDEPFYCRLRPIPDSMHALFNLNFDDNDPRILFKRQLCACWIGTKSSITPLHFDTCHGFLVVVEGTKKVTLFPPEDTMFMYREPGTSLNPNSSKVDWEVWKSSSRTSSTASSRASSRASSSTEEEGEEELEILVPEIIRNPPRHPSRTYHQEYMRLDETSPREVLLQAGEMLYIPPGWWHTVENVTATIAVLLPFDMVYGEDLHPALILL